MIVILLTICWLLPGHLILFHSGICSMCLKKIIIYCLLWPIRIFRYSAVCLCSLCVSVSMPKTRESVTKQISIILPETTTLRGSLLKPASSSVNTNKLHTRTCITVRNIYKNEVGVNVSVREQFLGLMKKFAFPLGKYSNRKHFCSYRHY